MPIIDIQLKSLRQFPTITEESAPEKKPFHNLKLNQDRVGPLIGDIDEEEISDGVYEESELDRSL